jgi:hypothetical protein
MSLSQVPDAGWQLNRQIGLALVVMLVLQGASVMLWAGRAGERISQLEQQAISNRDMAERMARLETHMVQAQKSLDRIEDWLDDQN